MLRYILKGPFGEILPSFFFPFRGCSGVHLDEKSLVIGGLYTSFLATDGGLFAEIGSTITCGIGVSFTHLSLKPYGSNRLPLEILPSIVNFSNNSGHP